VSSTALRNTACVGAEAAKTKGKPSSGGDAKPSKVKDERKQQQGHAAASDDEHEEAASKKKQRKRSFDKDRASWSSAVRKTKTDAAFALLKRPEKFQDRFETWKKGRRWLCCGANFVLRRV
jgi:hypothetical protein